MIDTLKESLANQFEAAFCTLNFCIDRCPDSAWDAPVVNLAFCQVVFHTLFYADVFLGANLDSLRGQQFHRDNADFFRDYEELEDRKPELLYEKAPVKAYLEYCRKKAAAAIAVETAESLGAPCDFERRHFSRAELYVYTIRHIQHHAANLSLRLRIDFNEDIPWCGSGWREMAPAR